MIATASSWGDILLDEDIPAEQDPIQFEDGIEWLDAVLRAVAKGHPTRYLERGGHLGVWDWATFQLYSVPHSVWEAVSLHGLRGVQWEQVLDGLTAGQIVDRMASPESLAHFLTHAGSGEVKALSSILHADAVDRDRLRAKVDQPLEGVDPKDIVAAWKAIGVREVTISQDPSLEYPARRYGDGLPPAPEVYHVVEEDLNIKEGPQPGEGQHVPGKTPAEEEHMEGPGYHLREIEKGTLGEASKIREELEEYQDALDQGCRIMQLVELSDLYGALEAVVETYGLTMDDLRSMSDVTKRAFRSGRR